MPSPYANPDFDGTVNHDGTAYLFPVKQFNVSDPDLAKAVNALFFADASRWPTSVDASAPYDSAGTRIPLDTVMVDSPSANAVVNWLAVRAGGYIDGAPADLPTWFSTSTDDASGTTPYVNPANSSNPDAIFALNYLLDNNPSHG